MTGSNTTTKLTRDNRRDIGKLIGSGYSPADISRILNLEYNQVYRAFTEHVNRVAQMEKQRRIHTAAFVQVMRRYFEIVSVLGNPGAVDYSQVTGGQGAQYAKRDMFSLIDFTVDVTNTAKLLDTEDFARFERLLENQELEPVVKDCDYVDFELTMGARFIARGLYPVTEYFSVQSDKGKRNGEAV